MKIYVASSWRNTYQPGVVTLLREQGHEVYDFRNPPGKNTGFGWREIHPQWEAWTVEQWRDALKHPRAVEGYRSDRAGMDWADACVLVLPSGRSAHLEAGFMAGEGKPVVMYAPKSHDQRIEPDLMVGLFGPGSFAVTEGELLIALEARSAEAIVR